MIKVLCSKSKNRKLKQRKMILFQWPLLQSRGDIWLRIILKRMR